MDILLSFYICFYNGFVVNFFVFIDFKFCGVKSL